MNGTRRLHSVPSSLLLRFWCVLALVALGGPGCALFNHNLRAVAPGAFYRSGQMPAGTLARTLRRHGIRTVISLRGAAPEEAWFQEEQAACAAQKVARHSLGWSKDALPDPESLRMFMDLCRDSEGPVLVHCQGGVHRSGVASAVYVLLHDGSMAEARQQLGLFFNDAPIGRLLDLYEDSDLTFTEWVEREYPRLAAGSSKL
jgi:protein tyrosine phosphatase (PTP) superfamily phosphohydrolase (DUF442 family)